jgi:hypothetical protein
MRDQSVNGQQDYEMFGAAVAVGKLNSDNYEDIAVGAPRNGPLNTYHGKVYIYLAWANGITTNQAPNATVTYQSSQEQFGYSVLIGACMGTNTYCLVVGAPNAAAGGSLRGSVYVFDAPLTSSTPTETQSGSMNNETLGYSLAGGKFAIDDFYRIVAGAPKFPGGTTYAGRVVILYFIPEFGDIAIVAVTVLGIGIAFRSRRRKSRRQRVLGT